MAHGWLVGIIQTQVGRIATIAGFLNGGVVHHRAHAVVAGILEIHAVPATCGGFVGGQQDRTGLGAVEVHAGLSDVHSRVGHEHDSHTRLNVVGARGETDVLSHKIRAACEGQRRYIVQVAGQLAVAADHEGHIVQGEVLSTSTSCREAEHILDVVLALVNGSGVVGAFRSPAAKHLVGTSSAVKDFAGSARSQSDGIVELLHGLGRAYIDRLAHEGGLADGLVRCGYGHISDIAVDGTRKGFTAAEENLVAESKRCALGVACRQVNVRKCPAEGRGIQGGVIELIVDHRAIVTAEDGQHAISEDSSVVIQGFGHFGADSPLAQSTTGAYRAAPDGICCRSGGIAATRDENL